MWCSVNEPDDSLIRPKSTFMLSSSCILAVVFKTPSTNLASESTLSSVPCFALVGLYPCKLANVTSYSPFGRLLNVYLPFSSVLRIISCPPTTIDT